FAYLVLCLYQTDNRGRFPVKSIHISMKAKLLQGKPVAEAIKAEVAAEVAELVEKHGIRPGLAVVRVGEDPASAVYVASKVRSSEEVGLVSRHHHLPAETPHDELLALVNSLNADDDIDGI